MKIHRSSIGPTETLWDLGSMLASAGVATLGELNDQVRQNEDVDVEVMFTNRGVLLYTSVSGIELVFPFMWQDFWSAIDGLELKYVQDAHLAEAEMTEDEANRPGGR